MPNRSAKPLNVDVGDVLTRQALHERLASAFRFPDYYGRNWDAFEECIRDVKVPADITVRGLAALRARLPREAGLFERCLGGFVAEDTRRSLRWLDG